MGEQDREKGRRIGEALTEARFYQSGDILKVAGAFNAEVAGVMLRGDEETIEGVLGHEVIDGVWVLDLGEGKRAFVRDDAVAGVFGAVKDHQPEGGDGQPDGEGGRPPDAEPSAVQPLCRCKHAYDSHNHTADGASCYLCDCEAYDPLAPAAD